MKPSSSETNNISIIYFGNERLATGVHTEAPVLRALHDAGFEICAVVISQQNSPEKRVQELEVEIFAKQQGIEILKPKTMTEAAEQLAGFRAHVGVLAAFGKMVPQSIIDLFPAGIVNLHPSLLPHHRGPTPIESVILSGDIETGVSLMSLVKEMDAGPIYAQAYVQLSGNESKQQLADELGEIGAAMIVDQLQNIVAGETVAAPQNEDDASYDQLITKSDGVIDWQKSAAQLEREIRAFSEWPKSRTNLGSIDVVITMAHVADGGPGKPGDIHIDKQLGMISIATTEGLLAVDKLKPAGKNEMPAAEFLRGYSDRISN